MKVFNASRDDTGRFIRQTSDGGYIITAYGGGEGWVPCSMVLIKTDSERYKDDDKTNFMTMEMSRLMNASSYLLFIVILLIFILLHYFTIPLLIILVLLILVYIWRKCR